MKFLKKYKLIGLISVSSIIVSITLLTFMEQKKVIELKDKMIQENRIQIEDLNDGLYQLDEEKQHLDDEMKNMIEESEQLKRGLEEKEAQLNSGAFISAHDLYLFQQLVEAEAGGESIEGKMAVANVVINRIHSENFPDTLRGVIYQGNQFEPVVTGTIYNKTPSSDSISAVKRVLAGERIFGSDVVNFWASWLDQGNELWDHVAIEFTIGVHHFGKGWK